MYDALDAFTNVRTWDSGHLFDEERFYQALDRIVRENWFRPEGVADYIERTWRRQYGTPGDVQDLENLKERYASASRTIQDYLHATGR